MNVDKKNGSDPNRFFYFPKLVLFIMALLLNNIAVSQIQMIRGQVNDSRTGEGLSKAVLTIQGAERVYVTGKDGRFEIPMKFDGKEMEVSYVGYESVRVKLASDEPISVALENRSYELPEMELTAKKYKGPEYSAVDPAEYEKQRKMLFSMDEAGMDVYESNASFPGGWDNLHAYIFSRFEYTPSSINAKQRGILVVGFTIDENGDAIDIEFIEGEGERGLSQEIISAIEDMPAWYPAIQYREPTKQSFIGIFPYVAK